MSSGLSPAQDERAPLPSFRLSEPAKEGVNVERENTMLLQGGEEELNNSAGVQQDRREGLDNNACSGEYFCVVSMT